VLVLGAGGAARSITVELALAGAQQITVVNRSAERGRVLTKLLGSKSPARASFSAWQGTYSITVDTDILVNATSIGLAPRSDERPDIDYGSIRPGMLVSDVIPAPLTPFFKGSPETRRKNRGRLGDACMPGNDWLQAVDRAGWAGGSYASGAIEGF
jgi:shikimate dehydrogenase